MERQMFHIIIIIIVIIIISNQPEDGIKLLGKEKTKVADAVLVSHKDPEITGTSELWSSGPVCVPGYEPKSLNKKQNQLCFLNGTLWSD